MTKNQFKINMALRDLPPTSRKAQDAVKIEAGNTIPHEMLKFLICYILTNHKRSYVTEARFLLGGRADVYDLTGKVVYEVLHSEKEENFEDKIRKYPKCDIIKIHSQHYKDLSPEDIISRLKEKMIL